jgi:hypothetical protein
LFERATILALNGSFDHHGVGLGAAELKYGPLFYIRLYLDERRVPLTASFAASHQPPKPRRPLPSDLHFVLSVVVKQGTTIF